MKSRYFANALGVFEGGGVRAAAFAGAYVEAIESGIRFNGVAGTSAGSIVAVLVAAGASPKFLLDELSKTTFADLLSPPTLTDRPFQQTNVMATLGTILPGKLGIVSTIVSNGGLYNSAKIENWVEELLQRIIRSRGRIPGSGRVTFRDLALPVFLLSADVTTAKPKVWSRTSTPEESVALAVRCSCSIPFFFQPVRSNSSLHVDGGIISNLPSYVFAEAKPSSARYSERILAFRLKSSSASVDAKFPDFEMYGSSVSDALVSGGTAVQLRLQPSVYEIEIDTGTIRATDFKSITTDDQARLIENGRSAVRAFVKGEQIAVSATQERVAYRGYDERMLCYVHMLQRATRSAVILDRSSYFVYLIFPTLLFAARRGISLQFICEHSSDPRELKRRITLSGLGFRVVEMDNLPFTGLVTDSELDSASAAVSSVQGLVGRDFVYAAGDTRGYTMENDLGVLSILRQKAVLVPHATSLMGTIRLDSVPTDTLFGLLRRVPQYSAARFTLVDLRIDDSLQCMQNEIKEFKLLQIADLASRFDAEGLELFSPRFAVMPDGSQSLITPPVVEKIGASLVLMEGHSRAYYCMTSGVSSMKAVLVQDVTEPLPARPVCFTDARVSSNTIPSESLFKDFNKSRFRPIEESVHE